MPNHETQELALLLRRWSEGSDEALEQLAFRVESELRGLARRYLRSVDAASNDGARLSVAARNQVTED